MQTMKNKVSRKLAKSWLGKSLIRVGQKVDEVWMGIGQYLVKSWSAFKAKEVGQNLDKSWTDFHPFRVCQGYANGMPEFWSNKLLQSYSSITPIIEGQLLQLFSNTSPEIERFSLNKSGQSRYEIGTEIDTKRFGKCAVTGRWFDGEMSAENCVKVSVWVRYLQALKVVQPLGETGVDLRPFYPAIIQVIPDKTHRDIFACH